MSKDPFTTVDLFCGAGGLSLGMQESGFVTLSAVENDPDAAASFKKHFDAVETFQSDIRDARFKKLRGCIDVVVGGPPCQPFSRGGCQRGLDDPRDMIPEFVRAVSEVVPRAFLLENVPNLVSSSHLAYFKKTVKSLEALGYQVFSEILTASAYGVPQRRKRLFLVGIKEGRFEFPKARFGVRGGFPERVAWDVLKDAPDDEPNQAVVTYAKNPVLRPSPYAGMLVNGRGRPMNLSAPAPTISASSSGNRSPIFDLDGVLLEYHQKLMQGDRVRKGIVEGVRRLTARESARLQTFPDNFEFVGAKARKFSQIGNAVPPMLAKQLGDSLIEALQ